MLIENFTGLIVAPVTPMYDTGGVNYKRIPDLGKLYEKNHVKGAFICGTTGEGTSLQKEEIINCAHAWKETNTSLIKILNVGGTCLKDMQELAQSAESLGFEGIAMMSPFFFTPRTVIDLIDFAKEVSAAAPHTPFYYYHIPSLSGGNFSMKHFLELASEKIPTLQGIKFTDSNLFDFYKARAFAKGRYELFWGTDEVLLSALVAGANGAVGSTYNYAAPLYKQIIQAVREGKIDEARALQDQSVQMVELLIEYGGTGATKAFMKIIGLDCGEYRAPVANPSGDQLRELEKALRRIGFFDFCSQL